MHPLKHSWTIYAHLPHVTDWSINSYKKIMTINTIEDIIELYRHISEKLINSCMLFIMKNDIKPMWEAPENINGGCFSYKCSNSVITNVWKELTYLLIGNTLLLDNDDSIINGITISPKKNFCIIKIWLNTCKYINPKIINYPKNLSYKGCIFKKHLTT